MPVFLDLCYLTFIVLALPYLLYKVLVQGKYIQGWRQRLGNAPRRKGGNPCLWVHGVSVGEVLAARKLVELFSQHLPDWEVVISTTTPTGQAVACKSYPGHTVFYFPMDFSWMLHRAFCRVRPTMIALMEVEIWPNLLYQASRQSVPVVLVNGSLSESSYRRYRQLGSPALKMLERITLFCMQTREYAERVTSIGIPWKRVVLTGSIKYDNLSVRYDRNSKLASALGLRQAKVLMGGSTHEGEEQALLDSYLNLRGQFPNLRLVLVPRHPERFARVEQLIRNKGLEPFRKSSLDQGQSAKPVTDGAVLLVDTLGELARLYEVADIVFVGGTLVPVGGHNLLEPAACGQAIIFGPQVFKQQESADQLLSNHAAIQIRDQQEITQQCRRLLSRVELIDSLGRRARQVITHRQGASRRTLTALTGLIEKHHLNKQTKSQNSERS